MKLKSTADGLKAVKEQALNINPNLVSVKVDGWYQIKNGAGHSCTDWYKTEQEAWQQICSNYQPLEVKEQIREEATDMSGVPNTPMPEYYKELGKRMEASNPELGVEELIASIQVNDANFKQIATTLGK